MYSFGYLLKEGVRSLWNNRTMTLASICVLISCLLLTGTAVLLTMNMSSAMGMVEETNSVTVYLEDDLPALTAVTVGEELRQLDNIASCEYVPKDEALQEIMADLGDDGTVFQGLSGNDNFLPDAYRISFEDISLYDDTIAAIQAVEGVDSYTDYSDVIYKLTSIRRMVSIFGVVVVAVLAVVSLFIISNTIKVTMFSRKLEIAIMKSVGATDRFVQVPFIVEGMTIGLLSSLLASGIIVFAYQKVVQAVMDIIPFFRPVPMDTFIWQLIGCFVLVGVLFGMLGGMFSIRRYLHKESNLTLS